MKALSELNRRQLSANMAEAQQPGQDINYQPLTSRKPARHRLHAVAAMEMPTQFDTLDQAELIKSARDSQSVISSVATNLVIRPTFNSKAKGRRLPTPMLTTEEFIQVRLATVRESTRHCYWPADVVARFAAADVIR